MQLHYFGNYKATGIQSIDLQTMTTRLREDWFRRYMLNPQEYRPGTRMPAAWPRGRSVVPSTRLGPVQGSVHACIDTGIGWIHATSFRNECVTFEAF